MSLSTGDLLRAASATAAASLEGLSVHDVHQALEAEYGALTDDEAYQVLDLLSGAEVVI